MKRYSVFAITREVAVFCIAGPKATEVLMKLLPVDFSMLAAEELRRTRMAQVPAAFWKDGDGYTWASFRSVAGYVMGLVEHSAQVGTAFSHTDCRALHRNHPRALDVAPTRPLIEL